MRGGNLQEVTLRVSYPPRWGNQGAYSEVATPRPQAIKTSRIICSLRKKTSLFELFPSILLRLRCSPDAFRSSRCPRMPRVFNPSRLRHFAPPDRSSISTRIIPAFQRKCNHLCLASLSRCPDGSRKGGVRHLGALYDPYSCNSSQFPPHWRPQRNSSPHPLWNENSRVDLPQASQAAPATAGR
jgi:hypothetical protein